MKKLVVLFLMLFCVTSLIGCGDTQQAVPTKPDDTTLEFWITEDVENVDFTEYDEIYGWYGAREYLGKGYQSQVAKNGEQSYPTNYVSYVVSAYPDYADGGSYITSITIADPSVKLYELTIQSTIDDFDATFEDMGYVVSDVGSTGNVRKAEKDGITFTFDQGRNIQIDAEISNRDGIVF